MSRSLELVLIALLATGCASAETSPPRDNVLPRCEVHALPLVPQRVRVTYGLMSGYYLARKRREFPHPRFVRGGCFKPAGDCYRFVAVCTQCEHDDRKFWAPYFDDRLAWHLERRRWLTAEQGSAEAPP